MKEDEKDDAREGKERRWGTESKWRRPAALPAAGPALSLPGPISLGQLAAARRAGGTVAGERGGSLRAQN